MLIILLAAVIVMVGLAGLILSDNKGDEISLYCYNECAEGKHYKRKVKMFNMI